MDREEVVRCQNFGEARKQKCYPMVQYLCRKGNRKVGKSKTNASGHYFKSVKFQNSGVGEDLSEVDKGKSSEESSSSPSSDIKGRLLMKARNDEDQQDQPNNLVVSMEERSPVVSKDSREECFISKKNNPSTNNVRARFLLKVMVQVLTSPLKILRNANVARWVFLPSVMG
ncbi:hypothetical protein Q3G72_019028 [Acer saccharum]|nr:hypothetical protein Q3G72_019028 [Acer saccharum]